MSVAKKTREDTTNVTLGSTRSLLDAEGTCVSKEFGCDSTTPDREKR